MWCGEAKGELRVGVLHSHGGRTVTHLLSTEGRKAFLQTEGATRPNNDGLARDVPCIVWEASVDMLHKTNRKYVLIC